MVHHSMLNLLTTGTVRFHNEPNHPVISRILPAIHEYDEDDLMKDDEGILEDVKEGRKQVKVGHATIIMGMFAKCFNQKVMMASMFAVGAMAQDSEPFSHSLAPGPAMATSTVPNYGTYFEVYLMIFLIVVGALYFERFAQYGMDQVKNKIFTMFRRTQVKVETVDDGNGPMPMEVEDMADLQKNLNRRKRQIDDLSYECSEKKQEAERWENVASEYAAKLRGLREELEHEQARTFHYKDKLDLAEKNRDDAILDRNEWEKKYKEVKENLTEQETEILELRDKINWQKDVIADSGRNTAHHKNQLNIEIATNAAEVHRLKDLLKAHKEEITKLKAALEVQGTEVPGVYRPAKANKASNLFEAAAPRPSQLGQAAPSNSQVNTSPEQLAAVIDKQSFELVEMKKKLNAAEEHVLSLRREIQAVKTPDVVAATKAGQCFHKHDCNHLRQGREPRNFIDLKKCKDCFP
jgi:chromosome segregation ATPase